MADVLITSIIACVGVDEMPYWWLDYYFPDKDVTRQKTNILGISISHFLVEFQKVTFFLLP
jgi:hypothetical protein